LTADARYGARVGDRVRRVIRRAEAAGGYYRDLGPQRRETRTVYMLPGRLVPVILAEVVGEVSVELAA
jgi:hypothetical protein